MRLGCRRSALPGSQGGLLHKDLRHRMATTRRLAYHPLPDSKLPKSSCRTTLIPPPTGKSSETLLLSFFIIHEPHLLSSKFKESFLSYQNTALLSQELVEVSLFVRFMFFKGLSIIGVSKLVMQVV